MDEIPGRITYVEHTEGNSTSKRCLRSDRECISARDRTISREENRYESDNHNK